MDRQNHALAVGTTIKATSRHHSGFPASSLIDGIQHPNGAWGSNGAWASREGTPFINGSQGGKQRIDLDLGQVRHIDEVKLFGVKSDVGASVPSESETTIYANEDFTLSYWNGSAWVVFQTVTANDKVLRFFTGLEIYSRHLRLEITKAPGGFAALSEIEVWGNITSSDSLTLSPSTFPDAVNLQSYLQTLTGGGGTAPYKVGIGANLPVGIGLTANQILGTPDLPKHNILFVTEGDSKTSDQFQRSLDEDGSWGYKSAISIGADYFNIATLSQTLATMIGQQTEQLYPLFDDHYAYKFAAISAGTNDIYFEETPNSTFVDSMKANLETWCDNAIANGFLPIVATIQPRSDAPWTSDKETARTNFNTWLRANYASIGAIILLDWEVDNTLLNDSTNTTYYTADGVHDKSAGQTLKAAISTSKINAYIAANPQIFTSPETFSFNLRVFDNNLKHADISYSLDVAQYVPEFPQVIELTGASYELALIPAGLNLKARIRTKDEAGNYSAWSQNITFTT